MASFEAKIGLKRVRTRENENYRSVSFPSGPARDRKLKKKQKKFENLKNTIMASFQAKLGTKRLRMSENKNYRSVPFQPNP